MTRQRFDVVPAIQWHEGMLLSSHHLQQSDLRYHQIITQRLKYILPFNYGVTSCAKDEVAFGQGILRITDLSGVLSDGEILDYDIKDSGAQDISLDLNLHKEQLASPTYIWCGMPKWSSHRSPFDILQPRFRVVAGTDVADNHDQASILTIPRLEPILTLYMADTPKSDFVSIPLFKAMYDNGQFICCAYEPPCFYLDQSGEIFKRLTHIAVQTRQHIGRLTEKYKHQKGTAAGQQTHNTLYRLNSILPVIEHIVSDNPDHPYDIYRFVNSMVGKLSMLNPNIVPPVLPKYQHDDLQNCFIPRLDLLQQYLDAVDSFYNLVPFQQKDQIFYYEPFMAQEPFYVGVKFASHVSVAQRIEWAKNAIITDGNSLEQTILTRTLGYNRTIIGAEDYPNGLYNYDDVLIRVEPPAENHDMKLIVFNPIDDLQPLPLAVYFAER